MDLILRRLLRAGMKRGMAGDWSWLVIAACAYVLRRALKGDGGVVTSFKIAPGEQVLVTVRNHDDPPGEAVALVSVIDET